MSTQQEEAVMRERKMNQGPSIGPNFAAGSFWLRAGIVS
jgi:hypothetical protein